MSRERAARHMNTEPSLEEPGREPAVFTRRAITGAEMTDPIWRLTIWETIE